MTSEREADGSSPSPNEPQSLRRLVVGTAGHVDHGKTALVQALTGVDCDRWDEEKRRGITIDLGFAHRIETTEDGETVQVGFVDVPGHERFVHNALAGLGGIDLMMLVVAADEGVKPQTREHLAICDMLKIPAGVVALSKSDLVDPELLELAQLELEDELRGTHFETAPVVPTSSRTGEGLEQLVAALLARAQSVDEDRVRESRPGRLPVDRAFQLQGLGVLVTGTLHSGEITAGDVVRVEPSGASARVRSVQVHAREREAARAGERASLQLVGVGLDEVARGAVVLGEKSPLRATRRLLVDFELIAGAPENLEVSREKPLEVQFHLLSAESTAKLRPLGKRIDDTPESREAGASESRVVVAGESARGEVLLATPVVAVRGDRFVLRRSSPRTTVGGGRVLDPLWRPRAKARDRRATEIARDLESAMLTWVDDGGDAGIEALDVAARLGVELPAAERMLEDLAAQQRILTVAPRSASTRRWLAPRQIRRVGERAKRTLEEFFDRERLAQGMPRASLVSSILSEAAQPFAEVYLDWLSAQKLISVEGDMVNLPGRRGMSEGESDLATKITEAFVAGGLTPPSPQEICRTLGAKPQLFEGLVKHLISKGRLVRLPDGLILASDALDQLASEVRERPWDEFTVPEFKTHFQLTRKWAIPLLEALDRRKVTRRSGNARQVLRPRD